MTSFTKASIVALAVLAGTVSLASAASHAADAAALERAQARVDRVARETKGGAQSRLLLERQRIQRLIDDLDAGRPVDVRDVDRALQRAENPGL